MAADMFLEIVTKSQKGGKVSTIWGESNDSAFTDLIQVETFEVGVNSPTEYDKSQKSVSLQAVKFTFPASYASTALFTTMCNSDPVVTATLTVRRPGAEGAKVYLQWRFHNARLTQYKMTGQSENATDEILLVYTGIEILYVEHTRKGDQFYATQQAHYDQNQNKMVATTLDADPEKKKS
jgi:type VI protein secretion system component Hcp